MKGDADALAHAVYAAVAKQYFGFSAYALPSSDAWLSDAVSEIARYVEFDDEMIYQIEHPEKQKRGKNRIA